MLLAGPCRFDAAFFLSWKGCMSCRSSWIPSWGPEPSGWCCSTVPSTRPNTVAILKAATTFFVGELDPRNG
jgi:hypothetical protein